MDRGSLGRQRYGVAVSLDVIKDGIRHGAFEAEFERLLIEGTEGDLIEVAFLYIGPLKHYAAEAEAAIASEFPHKMMTTGQGWRCFADQHTELARVLERLKELRK